MAQLAATTGIHCHRAHTASSRPRRQYMQATATGRCNSQPAPSPLLQQSRDSWGILDTAGDSHHLSSSAVPRLLLVDGTNLGSISAGSRHLRGMMGESLEERFVAWLRFLEAFTSSSGAADLGSVASVLAGVLVAFDNKGSAGTNVRAQLMPTYLSKRYNKQPTVTGSGGRAACAQGSGNSGIALSGWSELGNVVEQLHLQRQHQAHMGQQAQPSSPGYMVAQAAYGFEADDVLAAAVAWCRTQLQPRPQTIIASSDSDMQQLLDDNTYWLELLQVASPQHPSGVALHSAAAFRQAYGFEPRAYPDYLALVGKKEASIPGIGLSPRLAKTLLGRFGSLEAILSSRDALKPFGVAHKLMGANQPGADDNCNAAARNLSVLRMWPERQQLPEEHLQQCYRQSWQQMQQRLLDTQQQGQQQPQTPIQQALQLEPPPPQQQQQLQQLHHAVAMLHPARRLHVQQCQPYLQALCDCLSQLGLSNQHRNWMSSTGLWCDLLVQVNSAGSAPDAADDTPPLPQLQNAAAGAGWLAIQLLSPAELCAGHQTGTGLPANYTSAVALLSEELAEKCGSFANGRSALGHPKRSLLKEVTSGAKRHLALLKGLGMPVVVVPFFELDSIVNDGAGSALGQPDQGGGLASEAEAPAVCGGGHHPCMAVQYTRAVLLEHYHGH